MFQTQINTSLLPFSFLNLQRERTLLCLQQAQPFSFYRLCLPQSFKNFRLQASETLEAYIA